VLTNARWLWTTSLLLGSALLACVGVVLFSFHVAIQQDFLRLLTNPYSQVQDYSFSLNHEDCDIVIYGDSSAMTGDDPAIIEARTHLKTCNISQTQPTLLVLGMLPVELYLKRNKLPKYLVIQLAPDGFFQLHQMDKIAAFDPITLMLRHDAGFGTDLKMLEHPMQALQYASLVLQDRYKPNVAVSDLFRAEYDQSIRDYLARRGILTLPKPSESACGVPKLLGQSDFAWAETARRRYTAMGVTVLVEVSPIPVCDTQVSIYRENLRSHLSGEVSTLPIEMFNDSERHFTVDGARLVSELIANKILKVKVGH
jgi:hypothetical protein